MKRSSTASNAAAAACWRRFQWGLGTGLTEEEGGVVVVVVVLVGTGEVGMRGDG